MVRRRLHYCVLLLTMCLAASAGAEQAGGIRGMVYDKDFEAPLAAAKVLIAETGVEVATTAEGNYVFTQVEPGTYTLVFSKEGYTRQVKGNVVVSQGKMTELNVWLAGEFAEMEEFIAQDVQIAPGTETALLELRLESAQLMDSISTDLMSRAGASDAASALKLVAGASVQEGKYAVIRGLPDRYVNSQMNGVRLPTADSDKRAVQLDQFPAAVIESIQVSKTFTPDQQGDASGGAVNVVLKGIPEEKTFKLSAQYSYNTQAAGNDKFLTYKGGGLNCLGKKDIPIPANPSYFKAAGVTEEDAPIDYKWSVSGGGKHEFDTGFKLGGFGSLFYERDSSFFDDGIDDKYWVLGNSGKLTPQLQQSGGEDFFTSLFDVTQASQSVQWGGLGVLGLESENHALTLLYMYTRDAQDKAVVTEDTRGKQYYFPGYNHLDPDDPGNSKDARFRAPYRRSQTLEYTERTTDTLQLSGRHTLSDPEFGKEKFIMFTNPELDWVVARSSAGLYQPDKRLFGAYWLAEGDGREQMYREKKPGDNVNLGNFQRIWKDITETSDQYSFNMKFPFEQWTEDEGYLKFGLFNDKVERTYKQESFSNSGPGSPSWDGPWESYWSDVFPFQDVQGKEMFASEFDVNYDGEQNIFAWYGMADIPLTSFLNIIGGARFETTELSIVNDPDRLAFWIEPGSTGPPISFNPAYTDVSFNQDDMLPSIGFELEPIKRVILRGSYSETIARQTFKELSPIFQQEYLGGDVFIGNADLKMSSLKNYDLRLDYTPYDGGFLSLSYFYKEVIDPIEYVRGNAGFDYTYPVNYPEGNLNGLEFEIRQNLEHFWKELKGLSLGANATFIDSEVTLPKDEAQYLKDSGAPEPKRDMTNTPEHLYNLYFTYDLERTGTQFGMFYSVRGDTLVAGAKGSAGGGIYLPNVYEIEYGTLNMSLSQRLNDVWKLKFQAKNITNPKIDTVYRSNYISSDVPKTSYRKGMEFSLSVSAGF